MSQSEYSGDFKIIYDSISMLYHSTEGGDNTEETFSAENIERMTCAQLRDILKNHHLPISGAKQILRERVMQIGVVEDLDMLNVSSAILQHWFMKPFTSTFTAVGSLTEEKILNKLPINIEVCTGIAPVIILLLIH